MADSGTKTYKAAKRYIYSFGGGTAEGNRDMKNLLGGKGSGLAECPPSACPSPRLHHHHRGLLGSSRPAEAPHRPRRRPGRR